MSQQSTIQTGALVNTREPRNLWKLLRRILIGLGIVFGIGLTLFALSGTGGGTSSPPPEDWFGQSANSMQLTGKGRDTFIGNQNKLLNEVLKNPIDETNTVGWEFSEYPMSMAHASEVQTLTARINAGNATTAEIRAFTLKYHGEPVWNQVIANNQALANYFSVPALLP